MTPCCVCGRTDGDAVPLELTSGKFLAHACPGECTGLNWERYFIEVAGLTDDKTELQWRWRRHVARRNGRPFSEAVPKSLNENRLDALIALHGIEAIAAG